MMKQVNFYLLISFISCYLEMTDYKMAAHTNTRQDKGR